MLTLRETIDFFSSIKTGDEDKLKILLKDRSISDVLEISVKLNIHTLKYIEIAIDLALKHQQFDILKGLIIFCHENDLRNIVSGKNDPHHINILILMAIKSNNTFLTKVLCQFHWQNICQFKDAPTGDNFFQLAVRNNSKMVLEVLFSWENLQNTHSFIYKEKICLLEFAKDVRPSLLNYLKNKLYYILQLTRNNLYLPYSPLKLRDFFDYENLMPKALPLLLEYYTTKKTTLAEKPKALFALGMDVLSNALQLFIESSEQKLTLLFARMGTHEMGGHRDVWRFEKYKGQFYIIQINSSNYELTNLEIFRDIIIELTKNIPQYIENSIYCTNITNQQTDGDNCSHFALKNISKLLTTPSLAQEILEKKPLPQIKTLSGFKLIQYRLPARFMYLAQSFDRLQAYIATNQSEDLNHIRTDQTGKTETLAEYAYHHRTGYDVTTPQIEHDRRFPRDRSKMVFKNLSIQYFASKHRHLVPTLFKQFKDKKGISTDREENLRTIIRQHDASNLVIEKESKKLKIR